MTLIVEKTLEMNIIGWASIRHRSREIEKITSM